MRKRLVLRRSTWDGWPIPRRERFVLLVRDWLNYYLARGWRLLETRDERGWLWVLVRETVLTERNPVRYSRHVGGAPAARSRRRDA